MKVFDLFKKKPKQQDSLPEAELERKLFDAIIFNRLLEFEDLCHQNEETIIECFPAWRKAPEEVRADASAANRYAHCLMVIADYFQRELGRNEPTAILTGVDGSNPIKEWQLLLGNAQALMAEGCFAEARELLINCLSLAQGLSGTGVDKFLPVTLGNLSECYFQLGRADAAVEPMAQALDILSSQNDVDAEITYLGNLYEIHRYLDNWGEAANFARQIEQAYTRHGRLIDASYWRGKARAAAGGEPPLRIVVKIGDEYFEVNEIPAIDAPRVEFVLVRHKRTLRPSEQLCEEAKQAAEKGHLETALELFARAIQADRFNPVPHYHAAAIQLHKRRYREAVEAYERVEALCPGWETSRSELWLAKKLSSGEYEHDAYTCLTQIRDETLSPETRLASCERILERYPDFAEVQYQKGKILALAERNGEAVSVFRQALEICDDPDLRTRLLRDLSLVVDGASERLLLLEQAIQVERGNLLAQAMCHYLLALPGA